MWLVTLLGQDFVLHTPDYPHPSRRGHSPAGAQAGPPLPACALRWDSEHGSWTPWARWLRGESLPWALAATPVTLLNFLARWAFALGGHLGAGEVLRATTAPCCSQAQECHLSWGALTRTTMERAGLRRTCLQRPHGGYGTLSLRSELKARSCQQLQGRKAPRAQLAVPSTHSGKDQWGTLWGHEKDHLFLSTCPASHVDSTLTQAWPGAGASALLRAVVPTLDG